MKKEQVRELVFAAMCLALGVVLPSLFHLFGGAGNVFLPMHIPVLLCGFICGPIYGVLVGALVPFLCSIFTGMPPLFPVAIVMMFELAVYGVLTGFFRGKMPIYATLIGAMIGGRIVNGLANVIFLGMVKQEYSLNAFLMGGFITALPGIIIQLILIPVIVYALKKAKVIKY